MRARYSLSLAGVALMAALGAYTVAAQEDQHQHPAQQGQGGGMQEMQGMHDQDMQGAMERMHQQMSMPMSGDTDVDFARMMIPHHQGAIATAKVELEKGKDPQLRKMAQAIITAQEKEIGTLKAWLAKHDKQ